jgi:hypothetical protein
LKFCLREGAYVAAAAAGRPAYVREEGEVPLTAALVTMGVGIGPAFTSIQASVGAWLPTLMMLPKLIGSRLTVVYLSFSLLYSGCERKAASNRALASRRVTKRVRWHTGSHAVIL